MRPDEIDLQALAEQLRSKLRPGEIVGYLRGKSLMRDVLVDEYGYSQLAAEELIDTMELQGFLHFLGDPSKRSVADAPWDIEPHS